VWFAKTELTPEKRLPLIFDAISRADCVIALLTEASINSVWVEQEIDRAVLLSIQSGRPNIVPVRVGPTEPSRRLMTALGGRLFVEFDRAEFDVGCERIRAALRGIFLETGVGAFRSFVAKGQVVVPQAATRILTAVRIATSPRVQDLESADGRETRARVRKMLEDELLNVGVVTKDIERVIKAFDDFLPLPAVGVADRERILRLLRRADDTLLALAEELWRLQKGGKRGVTLRTLASFARKQLNANPSDAAAQAQALGRHALEVGLLEASTEDPAGYAAIDAQTNPSYDIGALVRVLGPSLDAWRVTGRV
jgi:TIR domain